MTISTNAARNEYTATAGQTIFNYTFKIYTSSDLQVFVTASGNTANDTADEVTGFSVTGVGTEAGGTITLVTAASVGDKVTIVSNISSNRTTDYQNNGDFVPDTVNDDFDRAISIIKQSEDLLNRTLVSQKSLQNANPLSLPSPEATKMLKWKSDLSGLENFSVVELTTAQTLGTSVGDIVALVSVGAVGSAAGWPALAGDNITFNGSAVGDVINYDVGATSGAVPLLESVGSNSDAGFTTLSGANLTNLDAANIKDGTDGEIITWDSAGSATTIGPGTDGQVLKSQGAGMPPAFEDTTEITYGSSQALTTAMAAVTFSGIPSGTNRVTVVAVDAGLQSAERIVFRIGDTDGLHTSGYKACGASIRTSNITVVTNSDSDLPVPSTTTDVLRTVKFKLDKLVGNTWSIDMSGNEYVAGATALVFKGSARVELDKELTQVSILSASGGFFSTAQTSVTPRANIFYE